MSDNVLIDTSAWIVSFKGLADGKLKKRVIETLDSLSAATTNVIIMELLQGSRDKKEYHALKSRMEALEVLKMNANVWEIAYQAGYELRRKGITVPAVDIIIASVAKEYNCTLLHHDKHYRIISKHIGIKAEDYIGT